MYSTPKLSNPEPEYSMKLSSSYKSKYIALAPRPQLMFDKWEFSGIFVYSIEGEGEGAGEEEKGEPTNNLYNVRVGSECIFGCKRVYH